VFVAGASSSGYQLFSREMLVQLRDVKANERLQEIGRRWVALSDDEKRHWNRRKDAMWVQYRKDLAKFIKVRRRCVDCLLRYDTIRDAILTCARKRT